jgi:hypothetical protein
VTRGCTGKARPGAGPRARAAAARAPWLAGPRGGAGPRFGRARRQPSPPPLSFFAHAARPCSQRRAEMRAPPLVCRTLPYSPRALGALAACRARGPLLRSRSFLPAPCVRWLAPRASALAVSAVNVLCRHVFHRRPMGCFTDSTACKPQASAFSRPICLPICARSAMAPLDGRHACGLFVWWVSSDGCMRVRLSGAGRRRMGVWTRAPPLDFGPLTPPAAPAAAPAQSSRRPSSPARAPSPTPTRTSRTPPPTTWAPGRLGCPPGVSWDACRAWGRRGLFARRGARCAGAAWRERARGLTPLLPPAHASTPTRRPSSHPPPSTLNPTGLEVRPRVLALKSPRRPRSPTSRRRAPARPPRRRAPPARRGPRRKSRGLLQARLFPPHSSPHFAQRTPYVTPRCCYGLVPRGILQRPPPLRARRFMCVTRSEPLTTEHRPAPGRGG